ncbi:MAG: (Na+)-NQR maturation NqrM [Cycloclasticus sp.]
MNTFLITFLVFLLVVTAMAVGVIFSNRKIKGSCGGLNNVDGLEGDCVLCSKKKCEKKQALRDSKA